MKHSGSGSSLTAQAGRPGINWKLAQLGDRSLAFRPELLKISICITLGFITISKAQTTAPARSEDAIRAEIESAHQQFKTVVKDPEDISDPVRRKAIAPQAIPPLKTLVADFHELSTIDPQMKRRAGQIELQFNAFLSVLGDQATIDHLNAQASSKDMAECLRGQASQLLARWVLALKDENAQAKLADEIETLDRAHPDSEDLIFLTAAMGGSAESKSLSQHLMQVAKEMQNHVGDKVRKATEATSKP